MVLSNHPKSRYTWIIFVWHTGVETTTLGAPPTPVPLRTEWIGISQVYISQDHSSIAYS